MANWGKPLTAGTRRQQAAAVSKLVANAKVERFDCGIHDITYSGLRPGCPLCDSERAGRQLQEAVKELNNKLRMAVETIQKLQVQVDIVAAIREAVQLLDDEDLSFLKSVLYMHRDQKSVALKVTHGARMKQRKGEYVPPNGFIVMPRSGDPYGHLCTSVGGLAIAEYFEEATNTVGPAQAMAFLVKGMAHQLPGAIR